MPAYHARVSLEAHHNASGALIINVLHAEVDTLTSPPNWNSIATDVGAWLQTPWLNLLTQNCTFDQIVVTDENYPGTTSGQGVHVVGLGGNRTFADDALDRAQCGLLSFKTAVAKRYARGHMFLPPIFESGAISNEGTLTNASAYKTTATTFFQAIGAGHTSGSTSYTPEVFSRTRVARGETPFSFTMTGIFLDTHQHYLRSRLSAP